MFFKSKYNHHEEVYKSAYKAFFGLCMRYCDQREDAEEVFNDGMVKYFEFEKKNKVRASTRYALIKKILVNSCIDRTRKKTIRFTNIDDYVIHEKGVSGEVEYLQMREELLLCIQKFPPQTRVIFNLYIFEGWSHKEIAKHLNISENTSQK